jgi:hypothetical protein
MLGFAQPLANHGDDDDVLRGACFDASTLHAGSAYDTYDVGSGNVSSVSVVGSDAESHYYAHYKKARDAVVDPRYEENLGGSGDPLGPGGYNGSEIHQHGESHRRREFQQQKSPSTFGVRDRRMLDTAWTSTRRRASRASSGSARAFEAVGTWGWLSEK